MATDTLRLFFALDPPGPVRARVAGLQARMNWPARRVPPANFHITLVFLGQRPAQAVAELETIAGGLPLPSCDLSLDRLGHFPRAGVAWLGCSRVPAALSTFQAELARRLDEAAYSSGEHRWTPHLTLYRKMRKPFAKMHIEPIAWPIQSHCLMQSLAGAGGPKYQPLAQWRAIEAGE